MPMIAERQWPGHENVARVDSKLGSSEPEIGIQGATGNVPPWTASLDDDLLGECTNGIDMQHLRICEHCSNLDIPGLLKRRKRFRSARRSLNEAVTSTHCAFCRLVVLAFADQDDVHDLAGLLEHRQVWYRLRSANLATKWRPVAPLQSIAIEVEVQPEWPTRRTSDMSPGEPPVDPPLQFGILHSRGRSKYSLLQRHLESYHSFSNVKKPAEVVKHALKPQADIASIRQWLDTCNSYHHELLDLEANGRSEFATFAATGHFRLLDVRNGDVVVHRTPVRFATLSYVWGKRRQSYDIVPSRADPTMPLTNTTDVAYTVNLETLPQTVKDAVSLVGDLRERWLWIDKCCIDKDDDRDIHAVVSQMATIYENSLVTIIAACGADALSGLARYRHNGASSEHVATISSTAQDSVTIVLSPLTLPESLRRSRWNTRGWTFQESMLSPRCLFFTDDEVFFTCAKGLVRESYEIWYNGKRPIPQPMTSTYVGRMDEVHGKLMAGSAMDLKHLFDAVAQFTRRDLTHRGDRFDAFFGFLQRFEGSAMSAGHIQALSGLTGRNLRQSLLWSHENVGDRENEGGAHSRILQDTRASRALPSWSWVGWSGPVAWQPFPFNLEPRRWKVDLISKHDIVIEYEQQRLDPYCREWFTYPTPCLQLSLPRTVLHLLAATLRCHLSAHRTRPFWLLVIHSKDGSQTRSFQVSFPTAQPPSQRLCSLLQFTTIVLAPVDNARGICSMLAVQQDDEYTERLEMLQVRTNTGFGSQYFLEHFVRFEHIKLI